MSRICREAESTIDYQQLFHATRAMVEERLLGHVVNESISSSAVKTAIDLGAALILALTETGATARLVAKYRPPMPVICISPHEQVMKQCHLSRGLYPKLVAAMGATGIIKENLEQFVAKGYIQRGDLVVCVYGENEGVPGTTNVCKVVTV